MRTVAVEDTAEEFLREETGLRSIATVAIFTGLVLASGLDHRALWLDRAYTVLSHKLLQTILWRSSQAIRRRLMFD